jgi:N-acetylglutamate synthase-like GNAT family acetyltransferase
MAVFPQASATVEVIRPAAERDQATIRAMVRGEHINPSGLDWRDFMVAERDGEVVGAAQVRRYRDGSRELASLVVARHLRGQGIATGLMDALLAGEDQPVPVFTIVDRRYARRYARRGFRPIDPGVAPAVIRRTFRIGRLVTRLARVFSRCRIDLVVLIRGKSEAVLPR